jgi:hypothetical protein
VLCWLIKCCRCYNDRFIPLLKHVFMTFVCCLTMSLTFIQSRLLLIWSVLVLSFEVEAWHVSVQCTSRFLLADGLYLCCSAVNIDWLRPDSNIMMSHLRSLLIMLTFLWFVYSH